MPARDSTIGDPGVEIIGPAVVLVSRYDVTTLAAESVAQATLAVADLLAARTGEPRRAVRVDRIAACAAFAGERLFAPDGWQLPPAWDPIAGDYRTGDGWIRLHTNYAHHRVAVLRALDLPADCDSRDDVGAAAILRGADELEAAVVAQGGPAAVLHGPESWSELPAGRAAREQRLWEAPGPSSTVTLAPAERPLQDVRVLDLTRVIAGPVATRFLAAYGADVLRIDPPGFAEVPALLPEVTPGKHCTALDLRLEADRRSFWIWSDRHMSWSAAIGTVHCRASGSGRRGCGRRTLGWSSHG